MPGMDSWLSALWPWHLLVAGSAIVSLVCLLAAKGLRLHSAAVLIGAATWLLYWVAFVPWLVSSTPRASFDDNTTGIGLSVGVDCCAFFLGGYQGLLCVALFIQVIRVVSNKKAAAPAAAPDLAVGGVIGDP